LYFRERKTENDLGIIENFDSVKGNFYFPLLKYLVRNGYIDESYQDYMNHFYENSITRNDKIFLRSITDEKSKEFSYELKNPELILKYLAPSHFDQVETLNFDLFQFLLHGKDQFHEHLMRFIAQLEKQQQFDFISQFYERKNETKSLIEILNHLWPDIWGGIVANNCFTCEMRHQYAVDTLDYTSNDDIERMNENDELTDYISKNPDFLCIDNPDITRIPQKLILLEVRFENINFEIANKELFQSVYRSNLYLLNISMISLILNKVYEIPDGEHYWKKIIL
jgi:hypothetical protein